MRKFSARSVEVLRFFLPFAVVTTCMCGLVYLAVQQSIRQSANDPQIQLAEGVAEALDSGEPATSIVPETGSIDIAHSLATWAIIYDDSGKAVGSSAILDGATPQLPSGVFDYVKNHGEDRITWEPKSGVRAAIVVERYESSAGNGYVVVGRSLREIELREAELMDQVGAAWLVTLLALLIVSSALTVKKDSTQASSGGEGTTPIAEEVMVSETVVEMTPEMDPATMPPERIVS